MVFYRDRPDEMSNLESLVEKNSIKYSHRWSPSTVSDFEKAFSVGSYRGMPKALRKNIAYSLQYLQYIQLQFDELKLHSVISTQLCKSYVIIAMSIIEGVFYHLLKSNDQYKKEDWEELGKPIQTNAFEEAGLKKKHSITTLIKLNVPKEGRMDFESMIQKVRSNHLLKLPQSAYPFIKDLKNVRNKVHLHISKDDNDTDYNKLSDVEYYLARLTLYKVLTDTVFEPQIQGGKLEWIRPPEEKIAQITSILEARRVNNNKITI